MYKKLGVYWYRIFASVVVYCHYDVLQVAIERLQYKKKLVLIQTPILTNTTNCKFEY